MIFKSNSIRRVKIMARYGVYNPHKIIPERIMSLRTKLNMTQSALCEAINDRKQGRKINSSVISSWETGRRPIPDNYSPILSDIFGVTNGYLRGFTDDPEEEINKPKEQEDELNKIEITIESLYKYHNMPIYVVFNNYKYEDAWGIYDDEFKQIVFRRFVLKLTKQLVQSMKFYRIAPDYKDQSPYWNKTMLSMKEMLSAEMVYVSMESHDPAIRLKYNGWYRHNEDHTYLIKAGTGLCLPYEGLSVSFSAYPNRIP